MSQGKVNFLQVCGNVWITESVPPGSLVYHSPEITIVEGKYLNALP